MLPGLRITFALTCLLLSGCVTESTGGIPGPAPADARLAAQLDLARGYLEQRDWNRAKTPLRKALAIDANNIEAHVLSAVLFTAENEAELAEQHYKRALRIDPNDAQALNNYGSFLYSQGRYRDAVEPLQSLVKNTDYRARPQAFESLGLALLRLEDNDGARSAFSRALQLNPRLPRANLELADMAYDNGEYKAAATQFAFYNRLAKPNARSLCLGLKLAMANQDNDAIASYKLSLTNLFPQQADQCLKSG